MTMQETMNNIINIIIENTKKTGVLPWQKPWGFKAPTNFATGKAYNGVNSIVLSSLGVEYALTFNQAKALNAKVKKGSKGIPVVFWKPIEKKEDEKPYFILRQYYVFDIKDIEGLDLSKKGISSEEELEIPSCEDIVSNYGIKITHGGDRAFYTPIRDDINIPNKTSFKGIEEYYSTLFHEMTHSTGHEKRLDRFADMGQFNFGSYAYSKEELIAELGALFLCNRCNITTTFDNSAAYINGWLKALKQNPQWLFNCSTQASKAVEFILK